MSKEKENKQEDYIELGLKRLDSNLVSGKPPRIKWGEKYKEWKDSKKISYLEELACSMNHAAYLIQEERNKLNILCELKEKQLISMQVSMKQNMGMLQSEITRMNDLKQGFNDQVAMLNAKVRDLEKKLKEKE
jgi:hypothetical protein